MICSFLRRPLKRAGLRELPAACRPIFPLLSNQGGVAAVEFAFVLPVLMILLTGIIQMGLAFFVQNNMTNVSQETARLVALGELTISQGETYANDHLLNWGMAYTVGVSVLLRRSS